MPVQKAKNFRGTLFRLLGYFRPQKYRLHRRAGRRRSSARSSTSSARRSWAWRPPSSSRASSRSSRHVPGAAIDFDYIGHILLILIGLYLISSLFSYVQQYRDGRRGAEDGLYACAGRWTRSLRRLPLKFYDSRTHGEILSRAVNDMDNISTHAAAEPDAAHHLGRHARRRHRPDADHQPAADAGRGRHAAAEHPRHHDHRQALAALLCAPAAGPRRAERPRRGDVQRPQDRQGLWPRERVDRQVQRPATTSSTRLAGERSSSPA